MNATLLLDIWEAGIARPGSRARLMHRAACEGAEAGETDNASPGERSFALLVWRELLFGPRMPCIADCASCGERMEFELQRTDLYAGASYELPEFIEVAPPPFQVRMRRVRVKDIEEANGDAEALFARCVVHARKKRTAINARDIPPSVRDRIEEQMRVADPLLDMRLELVCAACSHKWSAPFDVAAFCWNEVERWAQRMLDSIHHLASAYGWSEGEVLALSARRRDHYLQMVAS